MKYIIALLTVVILMGCQNDATLEKPKFKTIMIKSFGKVETLPDQATFHINLNCLDKSVRSSKQCLVEKSNELISKLLSFGIKQEDILTTSVGMNKSYSWRSNSRVFESVPNPNFLDKAPIRLHLSVLLYFSGMIPG
ncbi:hypothetical protein D770_12305 [Flammeovirgaceae bacterium 311]|nr:hypothetical protein D770_12305 [Flammeovirgaceae bacterium 311]